MTVTLTSNYRETLAPETLSLVDKYTEEYALDDMLVFIDEQGEDDFRRYYEEYVELGENYGYDAVDAYLKIYDVCDLDEFTGRYIGEYTSAARMAQDYFEGDGDLERLDYRITIDWEETGNYLINHEVDNSGEYYFRCHY